MLKVLKITAAIMLCCALMAFGSMVMIMKSPIYATGAAMCLNMCAGLLVLAAFFVMLFASRIISIKE